MKNNKLVVFLLDLRKEIKEWWVDHPSFLTRFAAIWVCTIIGAIAATIVFGLTVITAFFLFQSVLSTVVTILILVTLFFGWHLDKHG